MISFCSEPSKDFLRISLSPLSLSDEKDEFDDGDSYLRAWRFILTFDNAYGFNVLLLIFPESTFWLATCKFEVFTVSYCFYLLIVFCLDTLLLLLETFEFCFEIFCCLPFKPTGGELGARLLGDFSFCLMVF